MGEEYVSPTGITNVIQRTTAIAFFIPTTLDTYLSTNELLRAFAIQNHHDSPRFPYVDFSLFVWCQRFGNL